MLASHMKQLISVGYKSLSVLLIVSFIASPVSVLAVESPSVDVLIEAEVPISEVSTPSEDQPDLPDPEPSPSSVDDGESMFALPGFEEKSIVEETSVEPIQAEEIEEVQEEAPEENGPNLLEESDEPPLPGGLNGQFSSELKSQLPETDLSTGALTYRYSIQVPPGRNGVQPNLSLSYNNQEASNITNIFGYGWSVDIPYIERINRTGIEDLYPAGYASVSFRSSLSGELARISSGSYGPKTDTSDFLRYQLASGSWSLTDKDGLTYLFGQTASSQQDNTTHSKAYKWMLSKVTDANGNFVTYEYFKNSGQIYPATVSWTGFGGDPGIFKLSFQREARTDADTYYTPGFAVKNNYRISRIEARISNSWVRRYDLDYEAGDNGRRSLLTSIIESGQTEEGDDITFPAVTFDYSVPDKGWDYAEDGRLPYPVGKQIADVNGDGMVDIVESAEDCFQCAPSQQSKETFIYLLDGSEVFVTASPQYVPPVPFYLPYSSPKDGGARLDDINGDFKADIYKYVDATTDVLSAHINTGTDWTASSSWNPEVPVICTHDCGGIARTNLFDVNGDGLTDVVQGGRSSGGSITAVARFNDGNGWEAWTYSMPVALTEGVYVLDANGDGLNDLVQSCVGGGCGAVYLNTGEAWVKDTTWATVSFNFGDWDDDSGARVADINGDNLPDLIKSKCDDESEVYLNTGASWAYSGGWDMPNADFVHCNEADSLTRIFDFTGDGMPDVLRQPGANAFTLTNQGEKADQLNLITLPQGGVVDVTYQSSHRYRDAGNHLLSPKLPVILQTVKQVTMDAGSGGALASESYSYENGDYFYNGALDRRLSGFGKVVKTDSSSTTTTYFHQGNVASSAWEEPIDHKALIGKPFRTDISDRTGNLYKRLWNGWSITDLGQDRWFVALASTQEQIYDGNASHKDSGVAYSYNATNGNLVQKTEFGSVIGNEGDGLFSDTGTDRITTAIAYASNSQGFFLPQQVTKTNYDSQKISETKNYYDSLSAGVLSNGNLTKQERWASASYYIDTERTYDSRGLVIQEKDPRDNITSSSYDPFFLYPTRVENAMGHLSSRSFDYSSGKVRRLQDPNNSIFEHVYDGLDRIIEERQPDIALSEEGFGSFAMLLDDEETVVTAPVDPVVEEQVKEVPIDQANAKAREIAVFGSQSRQSVQFSDAKYDIEIVSMSPIEGGVEVLAKAWTPKGERIGFGIDGSVEIERFKIYNPPVLVPDGTKKTIMTRETEMVIDNFKKSPVDAILMTVAHSISVKKQKFTNRKITEGKIGNTTYVFYPHAGTGTAGMDGYLAAWNNYDFPKTWNECYRTYGTADYYLDNTSSTGTLEYGHAHSSKFARCGRAFFGFDTSALPDEMSIYSAVFSLYGTGKDNSDGSSPTAGITAALPASNTTIVANDFDNVEHVRFADTDITYSGFNTAGYNNWTLNATGIASISDTGTTKFAFRFGRDIDNNAPSPAIPHVAQFSTYQADQTGTTNDPKLTIEDAPEGGGSAVPETKIIYTYSDTPNAFRVKKSQYMNGEESIDTYTYIDGLGRATQERKETETSDYAVRDFAYNDRNLLLKESIAYLSSGSAQTSPTGTTALYVTYTQDPLQRTSFVLNAIGSTSYSYDNWKTTTRDPRGKKKYFFHDAFSNLVRVDEMNNGASYSTNYQYNGNDNLTKITDALGNARSFAYDGLGRRLKAEDLHDPSDATFGLWTYTYDDTGNLASSSDPKGQIVNYTYDSLNRVLTENYTGRTGTEATFTYDACVGGVGRLCSVISPGSSLSYQYNEIGLKSRERSKLGSTTYQTSYSYDRQSNLAGIINPDNSEIQYDYNSAGQLNKIERKESGGGFVDVVSNFDYGPHGKVIFQLFANGASSSMAYDAAKMYRLSTKLSEASGGSRIQNFAYTYDQNNNITRIIDDSVTNTEKVASYSYDDLNRLTLATIGSASFGGAYTHTFSYDAIGNITSKSDEGIYTYASLSFGGSYANPHAVHNISGGASFSYDNNGNLTNIASNSSNIATISWDYKNQMEKYKSSTASVSYAYDPSGQRVKVKNAVSTRYYPTKSYNTDGTTVLKDIFTPDGMLVATIKGSGASLSLHYVHTDHLGSTHVVTTASGSQESLNDYYAYGELRINQGSPSEQRKYTGHEYDTDTGLNYANARYQSGKWGRFVSQDSVFQAMGDENKLQQSTGYQQREILNDPQLLNSYSYGSNNPLKYIDNDGNIAALPAILFAGALVNVGATALEGYISGNPAKWQDYVGAAVGGAAGAATLVSTRSLVAAGAVTNASEESVSQSLKVASGDRTSISVGEIGVQTAAGAAFGALPGFKVAGVTVGPGNFQTITSQIITKAGNDTIQNIAPKTFGKMIVGQAVDGAAQTIGAGSLQNSSFQKAIQQIAATTYSTTTNTIRGAFSAVKNWLK